MPTSLDTAVLAATGGPHTEDRNSSLSVVCISAKGMTRLLFAASSGATGGVTLEGCSLDPHCRAAAVCERRRANRSTPSKAGRGREAEAGGVALRRWPMRKACRWVKVRSQEKTAARHIGRRGSRLAPRLSTKLGQGDTHVPRRR